MPYPYKENHLLDYTLERSMAEKVWPGGVIIAGNHNGIIINKPFGYHTYNKDVKTQSDHLFDLASLTKVIVTTSVAMKLYEKNDLDLDEFVFIYKPLFTKSYFTHDYWYYNKKTMVRVKDLLAHRSGVSHKKFPRKRYQKQYVINTILKQPLIFIPGEDVVYSDNNFVILGNILETISGESLDTLFTKYIKHPLQLQNTFFNPPQSLQDRIVPTEFSKSRKGYLTGEVHDNLSYALRGVSGHAGLFSTGDDLAVFCRMMLNYGMYQGKEIIHKLTIEFFKQPINNGLGNSRCLGWDSPSDMSSGGIYLSNNSIGHTGYTGSSLWIDYDNDLFVILLTNAVHPHAWYKDKHNYRYWRNYIHSIVYEIAGYRTRNNYLDDNPMFFSWYNVVRNKIEYLYRLIIQKEKK